MSSTEEGEADADIDDVSSRGVAHLRLAKDVQGMKLSADTLSMENHVGRTSSSCELEFSPVQMPPTLVGALRAALERRGRSALVIPVEAARLPAEGKLTSAQPRPQTSVTRQAALSLAARQFRLDRPRRCSVSASRRPGPDPATPGGLPCLLVEGLRLRHVASDRRPVVKPSFLPTSFPQKFSA